MEFMKALFSVLAGMTFLSLTACDWSPNLPANDPKLLYLEKYHPQLKTLRDGVAYQIIWFDKNKERLDALCNRFESQDSRRMVLEKIDLLGHERTRLKEQILRIDAEAEKGIALCAFNEIDGGGTRVTALDELTKETQARLIAAQQANALANLTYKTGVRLTADEGNVPRAVPVVSPARQLPPQPIAASDSTASIPPVRDTNCVAADLVTLEGREFRNCRLTGRCALISWEPGEVVLVPVLTNGDVLPKTEVVVSCRGRVQIQQSLSGRWGGSTLVGASVVDLVEASEFMIKSVQRTAGKLRIQCERQTDIVWNDPPSNARPLRPLLPNRSTAVVLN